jgi:hypothetical protein
MVRRAVVAVMATAAMLLVAAAFWLAQPFIALPRTTPVHHPPVLAGQALWAACSGGVYARRVEEIVLTSSGHCATEGTVATDPDGSGVRGVFGPPARSAPCPHPDHTCAPSDINALTVALDRIPWGHLNEIDMGAGGYRIIAAGTHALSCAEVTVGDAVEMSGRGIHRSGRVVEKGDNLKPPDHDGAYFPCMIAANIRVATGDSGSVILVDGIPAGVASRSFLGYLGFTPLAEGLDALGLTMCDTPNCGLEPTDG